MNKTVEQIMQKSKSGESLTEDEIIILLDECIRLMDEFGEMTQDSINHLETFITGFLDRDRWTPGLL